MKTNCLLLIAYLTLILPAISFAEGPVETIIPRASIGYTYYGLDVDYAELRIPQIDGSDQDSDGQEFNVNFATVNIGATYSIGPFYLDGYYQFNVLGEISPSSDTTEHWHFGNIYNFSDVDVDRYDSGITIARSFGHFKVFVGYKMGETSFEQTWVKDNTHFNSTDIEIKGPTVGLSYTTELLDGSLNVNAALAFMTGTLNSKISNPARGLTIDYAEMEDDDEIGFNIGATWSHHITQDRRLNYAISLKFSRYEFEFEGKQDVELLDIDRNIQGLSITETTFSALATIAYTFDTGL